MKLGLDFNRSAPRRKSCVLAKAMGWPCLLLSSLLTSPVSAQAPHNTGSAQLAPEPADKKSAEWERKRAAEAAEDEDFQRAHRQALNKRIGDKPKSPVNIYNNWTHEYLVFDRGDTKVTDQTRVNQFLRCHFTGQPTDMDPRLLPVLLKAANRFQAERVDVVSGFRDPKYNLSLRKKGRQVSRTSQHPQGHAVDFRVRGVRTEALHNWARSLRLGGVGFYKSSRFIHVDVGPVRYWQGT